MKNRTLILLSGIMLTGSVLASEMIYTPVNPSFGGYYGNSSHLFDPHQQFWTPS